MLTDIQKKSLNRVCKRTLRKARIYHSAFVWESFCTGTVQLQLGSCIDNGQMTKRAHKRLMGIIPEFKSRIKKTAMACAYRGPMIIKATDIGINDIVLI